METTHIFYFSGTGNCLAIAKQIAEEYENTKIISITDKLINAAQPVDCNNCIVIFPAYAYGMPSILYKFFKKITINADYLAALVSCGSVPGSALLHAKRLCNKKGQKKLDYAGKIKSVENYIPIFGLDPDDKLKELVKGQDAITAAIIPDLKNRKQQNKLWFIRPFTHFVSILFRGAKRIFPRGYKVTDDCTKCGVCRDVCPASAIIQQDDEKPLFIAKKCEHCQGCLNWCPKRAINYIRLHPESRRYHHPDISLKEMLKMVAGVTDTETHIVRPLSVNEISIDPGLIDDTAYAEDISASE